MGRKQIRWNSRELASLLRLAVFMWWTVNRTYGQLIGKYLPVCLQTATQIMYNICILKVSDLFDPQASTLDINLLQVVRLFLLLLYEIK